MSDRFSKEVRSHIMSSIRSKDTKVEVIFRKALWKAGYKYRKNASQYFGKPDLILKKFRLVIFIDSFFWHGCPWHFKAPKSNKKYWVPKIENNKKRDKRVTRYYRRHGWKVLRFWEHKIKKDLDCCVAKTINSLKGKS